jgi:hypothetical protein
MVDYKTKWEWYDLRISIWGTEQMNWMADAIEYKFYREGYKDDLKSRLKNINPEVNYDFWTLEQLKEEYLKKED